MPKPLDWGGALMISKQDIISTSLEASARRDYIFMTNKSATRYVTPYENACVNLALKI